MTDTAENFESVIAPSDSRLSILPLLAWTVGVAESITLLNTNQGLFQDAINKRFEQNTPRPTLDWTVGIQALFYGTGIALAGFALRDKKFFTSPGMMLLTLLAAGALLDPLLGIFANWMWMYLSGFIKPPGVQPLLLFGIDHLSFNVQVAYLVAGCLSLVLSWSLPCGLVVLALSSDFIRRRKIDWWTSVAAGVFTMAWIGLIVVHVLSGFA